MQSPQTKTTDSASKRNRNGLQSKLLLVGSEDAFKSDTRYRVFGGHQFQIAGRSMTLLDALARLESGAIDIVLMSREFREEEISLFAFNAERRGFPGLIVHLVSVSNAIIRCSLLGNRELPDSRFGRQSVEDESGEKSENRLGKHPRVS